MVELSVLVISHNQKDLLPRCLDSILAQKIDVPYEVIVSDDRSSDGTWDVITDYANRYPGIIIGIKCNSDECNPVSRSERCGWNKATAYKHARGNFFVNIDADDYLKSNDIYQHQLDLLRMHPECAMCQQRVWQMDDGKPIESGHAWPKSSLFKEGSVLTDRQVILGNLQGLNQTYMIRRQMRDNPALKYGCQFDDTIITLFHLQFGSVVLTDRSDYVWVQYKNSISNSDCGDDREVLYAILPIEHAILVPKFRRLFMQQDNLELFHVLKKCVKGCLAVTDETKARVSRYEGFIFRYLSGQKKGVFGYIRILLILLFYRFVRVRKKMKESNTDFLYRLLVR